MASLYSLVYVFECKRILCSNTFLLRSVTNRMSVIDLAPFLHKSSTYSPFITTRCLEFIKTSLVHACLVWFLSWYDIVMSFLKFDQPFKQTVALNWWASGSAPASNPGVTSERQHFWRRCRGRSWKFSLGRTTTTNWFLNVHQISELEDCHCAPGDSTVTTPLGKNRFYQLWLREVDTQGLIHSCL